MAGFTDKANRALELSYQFSREMHHNYIGSEHILVGLLREGTGVAANVLISAHIEESAIVSCINEFVSSEGSILTKDKSGYTPSARLILEQSHEEAARFQADATGTEHLLIAILKNSDCIATRILNTLKVSSDKGEILVCRDGAGVDFSEEKAKEILLEKDIKILVELKQGKENASAWGCDLTYDYVKINGDYRS